MSKVGPTMAERDRWTPDRLLEFARAGNELVATERDKLTPKQLREYVALGFPLSVADRMRILTGK
jgi:hypothetical protein